MTYTIEQSLLPIFQQPLPSPKFIIAHESGNPNNVGPNALDNEVTYMKRMAASTGVYVSHWVGGGGRIIQIAKTGHIQHGAGRFANPYSYAQVELARTNQASQFKKDYQAYIWLLRKLANEAKIPLTLNSGTSIYTPGIKTHSWVSKYLGGTDHADPDGYLASFGISMKQFARDLERGLEVGPPSLTPNPKPHCATCTCQFTNHNKAKVHVVVKGDTLWSIAKRYQTTVTQLKYKNKIEGNLIKPGQVLDLSL